MISRITSIALSFFCFSTILHSQLIHINLKNKNDRTPISGMLAFVIDPVDSAVLGYAPSDPEGNCTILLSRPLKGSFLSVKAFGMGYGEYVVHGIYNPQGRKEVFYNFEPDPTYNDNYLFSINMNKYGFRMSPFNSILDSVPLVYYKMYKDTAEYYYEIATHAEQQYRIDQAAYDREMRRIDSLESIYPELSFIMSPQPYPPFVPIPVNYLDLSHSMNRPVEIDKGWGYFFDYFKDNPKFISRLKNCDKIRIWLSFEGNEPFLDTLFISYHKKNGKKERAKDLEKLRHEILNQKLIWFPVMIGGFRANLNDRMRFYIDIIYRKE